MGNKDKNVSYKDAEKVIDILMKHDKKCSYEIRESMTHFEFISNADIAAPIKKFATECLNISFEPCHEYSDKINYLNLNDVEELTTAPKQFQEDYLRHKLDIMKLSGWLNWCIIM